ncbi:PAS domain-containing protein [uncultured Kiloniella sp.]|uniref:PAS domain-containing protein n=1 Tax=uncultured Kiloniella sp. TaxID=1133091 RepID=UPI00261A3408|nr:PAS domain-containing protein [uncultured Kiloniella sp.]
MEQYADLDNLAPPVLGVYKYWLSLPKYEGLPLKSSLDPVDIPTKLLPHVFLVQLETNPFAALIRLQGTYINHSLGEYFTDKYINESTFGNSATAILAGYEEAAQKRVAYVSHEEVYGLSGQTMLIEAIHLPMVDEEEGHVNYFLGALSRISGVTNHDHEFRGRRWDVKAISNIA